MMSTGKTVRFSSIFPGKDFLFIRKKCIYTGLVYALLIVVMRERVSAGHDLALLKLESLAGQIEI